MSRRLQGRYGVCCRYKTPKAKYFKRAVAEFDLKHAENRSGKELNIFRCGHCGCWHIGSK